MPSLKFNLFCLDGAHRPVFVESYPASFYAPDTSLSPLDTQSSTPLSPSPIPFPSLHEPANFPSGTPPHPSDTASLPSAPSDDYSWEWGGFPQRSPLHIQYPNFPSPGQPKSADTVEHDEQLPAAGQSEEFQRSKSLPPEFELNLSEEASSPALQTSKQLLGQELLSDVETGYGRGMRTSSRERRSWVRWWRRDSRHPQSVDVDNERPSLRNAASIPLPTVSGIS